MNPHPNEVMTLKKHLVVIAVALAGCMAMTHSAFAHPTLRHKYLHLHAKLGHTAGRNIVKDGVRVHGRDRPASYPRIAKSIRTMRSMLAPRPAPAPAVAPTAATASFRSASSGGLPACADESAGNYSTGPANTNPTTGATGRWQTLRSHYARGGVCDGFDVNSPSGQDGCAHKIMEEQGSGAWVNC